MARLSRRNLFVERKNGTLPDVPFFRIKETILGSTMHVTVAFIKASDAKQLNETYRQKDYVPDILSFPLSNKVGEIYICLQAARKKASSMGMSYQKYLHLLFIHGCLHLKGASHGSTMEKKEDTYLSLFYRG